MSLPEQASQTYILLTALNLPDSSISFQAPIPKAKASRAYNKYNI